MPSAIPLHGSRWVPWPLPCRSPSVIERLQSLELRLEARNKLNQLKNDMLVLKNICEHPAACFQSFQA